VGKVFRTTYTKPLPAGAEIFVREGQRFARWKSTGRVRKAPIVLGRGGTDRVVIESPFYFARYRDGADVVRIVPTGCKDETAARAVLGDLERRAEHIRSGIMSANEESAVQHRLRPIGEHRVDYVENMRTRGLSESHRTETERHLKRIFSECDVATLRDLDQDRFERWLAAMVDAGASPRTRNCYRDDLVTFANWCVEKGRLVENPLAAIGKLNVEMDRRRTRRAMTEQELVKLLEVARRRPLLDAQTIRRGDRAGQAIANLKPETIETLDRLGRERGLIYKALVLTGLRKNELASLTVGKLDFDGPIPFTDLAAADEKNRQGSEIVLRDDLAADLRAWLAEKLAIFQAAASREGGPDPRQVARRYSRLHGAGRTRPHPRSEGRRHRQEGRAGQVARRARDSNNVWNVAQQERGIAAHRPGGHEAPGHSLDDAGLHGSEAPRRAWSDRKPSESSARGWTGDEQRIRNGDWHRGLACAGACANACDDG
jgi:integrase